MEFTELKAIVLQGNPRANMPLIEKAYLFAKQAHHGQVRDSGETRFEHACEVAKTLCELKLDSATVAAGLLHATISHANVKPETLGREFGDEVRELVEATTKKTDLRIDKDEDRAAYIRKVILATAKDIRVILIKLADRLHNMKTIKSAPPETQRRVAQETMDIYAPIAYKLGMNKIKAELEDLSFHILQPETYQELKRRMGKKKEERERDVQAFLERLEKLLKEQKVPARVFGRAKHFYSIWKKMQRKNLRFEEVTDLIAVRVITTSLENCYKILGIVHSTWKPIPGKFDDYITNPKSNMYQSLHTEVMNDEGMPVEIQIRTLDMHYIAEEGVAAHWRYKGTDRDKMFEQKINWLKQILTWKRESSNARDFIEDLKVDLFKDEIITFTPKGDPIILPEGATTIDFAYQVHTSIGAHAKGAKVNGKIVPLDAKLASGDVIEIVTQQAACPNRQWLNFVKTTGARQKIRTALGIAGLDMPDPKVKKEEHMSETSILSKVVIDNVKPGDLHYAKCCSPQIGDEIKGFIMKDHKVAIHKAGCQNLATLDNSKMVAAHFVMPEVALVEMKFDLVVVDRIGLLAELLNIVSGLRLNVSSIVSKPTKEKIRIMLGLQIRSPNQVQELMDRFGKVVGVHEVHLMVGKNRLRKRPHSKTK